MFSDCDLVRRNDVFSSVRWGYLAYDANVNKYLRAGRNNGWELPDENDEVVGGMARELRRLTVKSLSKMKSQIKIGEIVPGKTPETGHGFLASALTRLEQGNSYMDVFLVTVTFIRNREILTLTLYAPAESTGTLESIMAVESSS